ncbi:MAG: AmmeMemoRadiSam system protein B [bacterium]
MRRTTFCTLAIILILLTCSCSSRAGDRKANETKEAKKMKAENKVRKPAVNGMFYPGSPKELSSQVDKYLRNAEGEKRSEVPRILIVPHAGYPYSAQVAAYSFIQLKGSAISTVFLLGPSHRAYFSGVAADDSDAWETPLGNVSLDREKLALLMKKDPDIAIIPEAHAAEHSLEVQVPFLQKVLPGASIIPLEMLDPDPKTCGNLASAIAPILKENPRAVLIASSDLSHYYPYDQAVRKDNLFLSAVEKMAVKDFPGKIQNKEFEACGSAPVLTALMTAEKLGANEVRVLKYANSGDVTGDKSRVVGYAAVAFYGREEAKVPGAEKEEASPAHHVVPEGVELLSKEEQAFLLKVARETLEAHVRGNKIPAFSPQTPRLSKKMGVFVTLTKNGDLRGCIGYIQGIAPLFEAVSQMAVQAASHDPRFSPVRPEELKDIHIEISALSELKEIKDVNLIKVGTHGIIIKRGFSQGLLLPQVATEYGWGRDEFLKHTCLKAGLPPETWKEPGTQIVIFSALVFGE